jgi:amidophosphoribosyltransferase
MGVSLKFNALPEVLEGRRVVLVDDTIVRGTTSKPIIQLLRQAGAKEVHMRVHAPPMMWPCYLGVDLAQREELIAARMTVPEIGSLSAPTASVTSRSKDCFARSASPTVSVPAA